ncbi:hypothetical protein [Thiohalorhabdus methylotrophus]|uniref:Cytochrome C oxidase subunit III n=1 Tax=Thiohalorhabdus methylotrophus TaxID=3242694 RepID=A0ABV4TU30_9GAMM
MPYSASKSMRDPAPDRNIAIAAESLYLINLLPAPLVGFLVLLWLYRRHHAGASPVTRCHLRQTLVVSIWAGILIALAAGAILVLGGLDNPATWVLMILYVVCVHSAFILFGVVALSRAQAGLPYRYPLVGPRCEAG